MIKIYGSPMSSAGRCYVALEEIGQPYERQKVDMANKEHKSPAYLKLNPNGKVPTLVDGDFVIWESVAINQYLAEKYKPSLLGNTPEERGLVAQWSIWGLNELQKPFVDMLIQIMFVPADKKDPKVIAKAQEQIPPLLSILDQDLARKRYLVGADFSMADINLFSVVNISGAVNVDLSPYPNLRKWFATVSERPSIKKVRAMPR